MPEPQMDPTLIDWTSRQVAATIPFRVIDGRPVSPAAPTGIRHGRGAMRHWGEGLAADAIVTATDTTGQRWILLIERGDGHGWALPGGHVDPGEAPIDAAVRELAEETGLHVDRQAVHGALPARHVPDPRESDEAWMVTTPVLIDLGTLDQLPDVKGSDDASRAAWLPATPSYDQFAAWLAAHGGQVFAAHRGLLADILGGH